MSIAHITTGQLVTAANLNEIVDTVNLVHTPVADDGSVFGPLKGYDESYQLASISAGVITINYALGNHIFVPLNANVTSISVTNIPLTAVVAPIIIYYTADGTPRTITHTVNGNGSRFPGGSAPTMTSTNNKIDTIVYLYCVGLFVLASVMAQNQ